MSCALELSRLHPSVLIADDDADVREALADMLECEGYHVVQAGDGQEALCRALELRPDAVLLDHRMPEMRGADVFRSLAASGLGGRIVLMSATRELRSLAASVGARHALAKPFDAETLLAVLARVVRHTTGEFRRPPLEWDE